MKPDPMDALSGYYAKQKISSSDQLLGDVLKSHGKRSQKMLGAACGFAAGAAVAALVLAWAMRPIATNTKEDSAYLTRLQMVNTGLVSREVDRNEVTR